MVNWSIAELLRKATRADRNDRPVVSAEFTDPSPGAGEGGRLRTLGTFGGVFTPSFLTIIGVIMYLRFSWVVANAGLVHTVLIVVLANAITFVSALSVASIASNEHMETGGAYFMVSRVLGFQAGGGIGVPLFLSQALSIALYGIGFAEALSAVFPGVSPRIAATLTVLVLAAFALVGSGFMVKLQYVVLAVILASFVSIGFGFRFAFSNLEPAYPEGMGFWGVFAVFFPAVTGILAGVSMSGDLREPAKSIPRGTLLAVGAGFLVYLVVPIMLAFSLSRDDLAASTALRDASRWPALVTAGVMGATLSSAIGSLLAALRTLQALGIDRVVPKILGSGVGAKREPVLALLVSIGLALAAILLGNLDVVAGVLTMFFLTTYGVLNLSAGLERLIDNPSFRPAIRVPWWISFTGALACMAVMILIDLTATAVAVAAVAGIFLLLGRRRREHADPSGVHGGLWEGFWTSVFFAVSRRLARSRSASGKNWRPLVQVFASDVDSHGELMATAAMLTRRGGALATYALVDLADADHTAFDERAAELRRFSHTLRRPNVFTQVVRTPDFHTGVVVAAQAAAFAAGSYNSVMLGLPANSKRDREYTRMLVDLSAANRNVLLLKRGARPWMLSKGPLTVWWGGRENNVRLMLILAYLLQGSLVPAPDIVLSTIVSSDEEGDAACDRLAGTLNTLRMSAHTRVVVNSERLPVAEILAKESKTASLVVLGMAKPASADLRTYLPRLRETSSGLDSTLFVLSNIPDIEYI